MHFPHGCGNWIFRTDFPDVTLASEDDQQEEANKVVLSSASQKLNTEVLAQLLGEVLHLSKTWLKVGMELEWKIFQYL